MPRHYVTLPDVEQSVSRPIVFGILSQIGKITRLSEEELKINFTGPTGAMQTPGTSIDDQEGNRDPQFGNGRYVFIDAQETYQLGSAQETFIWGNEHMPVFHDPVLGVRLSPIYTTMDMVISFRFRSESKTEVKRWMAQQFLKTSQGRDVNLHDIRYTYPLPYPFLELIETIHEQREAVEGYGDTLRQYILQHISPRSTILCTQAGEMRHLAIKETQSRIQGMFDFTGVPDQPQRTENGAWELSFNYHFSYQRPDAMALEYPMAVHNQFLPEKYLPEPIDVYDPIERRNRYSKSYEALSMFELGKPQPWERKSLPYVRIPKTDDFMLGRVAPATGTWLTTLCFLDDTKQDLVSFNQLGDYYIDADIMEFFVGEAPWMTQLYQSILYVSYYKNETQQMDDSIQCRASDMMIQTVAPVSMRDNHRVRFALILDIHMLSWAALQRLAKFPKAFVKLLAALNELLANNPDFTQLASNAQIQPWELGYAYYVLTGGMSPSVKDYPWTDIANYGGPNSNANRFVGSIDPALVAKYYREKRHTLLTVQSSYIVIDRNPGGSRSLLATDGQVIA